MSKELLRELDNFYTQKKIACISTDKPETTYIIHKDEYRLTKSMNGRRKPEFITGRWCARKAIERLGHSYKDPILSGSNGEPIWPDFITGSLSHSKKIYCAIASNVDDYVSIGIDVEDLDRRVSDRAFDLIANDDEKKWVQKIDNLNDELFSLFKLLIFSAKESVFKAVYPLVQKNFSFDAVSLKLVELDKILTNYKEKIVVKGEYELVFNKSLNENFKQDKSLKGSFIFNKHHIVTTCLIDKKKTF